MWWSEILLVATRVDPTRVGGGQLSLPGVSWYKPTYDVMVPLRVQYSCGVALVFWLQREIVFGVMYILSVQYNCAVVSVFWL